MYGLHLVPWHVPLQAKEKDSTEATQDVGRAPSNVPLAHVDSSLSWVIAIGNTLIGCIISPFSCTRMRSCAAKGVSLLASCLAGSATESSLVSSFLTAHAKDEARDFHARRLLPLKSVDYAIGVAEAATWVLSLRPALMAWGKELSVLVNDALWFAELDEVKLLTRLPASRSTTAEALTRLRAASMKMLCGVMMLDDFQDKELKVQELCA